MIIINSPKNKLNRHKPQHSQPNLASYADLNSFNEYFKTHKKQLNTQTNCRSPTIFDLRCKTEASLMDNNQKTANQSTTYSNSKTNESVSPKHRFSNLINISIQSSKSRGKLKFKSAVAPFQCDEVQNAKLQKILVRTTEMLQTYQKREEQYKQNEQLLKNEISSLKARLEVTQKKRT